MWESLVCGCECVGVNFIAANREEELEQEGISDDQEWSKASGMCIYTDLVSW